MTLKPAVQVRDLCKSYMMESGELRVLRQLSFSVMPGEVVGVVGESGCGKSTLLHILGALDTPTSGQVLVGGKNPFLERDLEVSHFRNSHIGFVFQHNNLLPEFSALENVLMPSLISGFSRSKIEDRARMLLDRVGMSHRLHHFPGQLSGGEQQRIAIARALINNPLLVLADEPSGNLDSSNANNIHNLFLELNEKLGTTLIIVTHNLSFAQALPRRIELKDGTVLSDSLGVGLQNL